MRRVLLALVSSGALLAATDNASAGTATATIAVSATVQSNCLVSTNPLAFGVYQPGGGNMAVNTTMSVRCTKGTLFTIALNAGTTTGGSLTQRLMVNGTNTLQYNLYTTAALTTVWGDGTSGSATVAGTGNGMAVGSAVTETVYGQLPDSAANQALPPGGPYADTVTVTVTY
jgi:spore coat protein U-like protein